MYWYIYNFLTLEHPLLKIVLKYCVRCGIKETFYICKLITFFFP